MEFELNSPMRTDFSKQRIGVTSVPKDLHKGSGAENGCRSQGTMYDATMLKYVVSQSER